MAYDVTRTINDSSKAGATPSYQLVDENGVNVGSEVAAGFVERSPGMFVARIVDIPDGFEGVAEILFDGDPYDFVDVAPSSSGSGSGSFTDDDRDTLARIEEKPIGGGGGIVYASQGGGVATDPAEIASAVRKEIDASNSDQTETIVEAIGQVETQESAAARTGKAGGSILTELRDQGEQTRVWLASARETDAAQTRKVKSSVLAEVRNESQQTRTWLAEAICGRLQEVAERLEGKPTLNATDVRGVVSGLIEAVMAEIKAAREKIEDGFAGTFEARETIRDQAMNLQVVMREVESQRAALITLRDQAAQKLSGNGSGHSEDQALIAKKLAALESHRSEIVRLLKALDERVRVAHADLGAIVQTSDERIESLARGLLELSEGSA